jgi:hypothetical protein
LERRVRNIQGHPHVPTIPRSDGQKPLGVLANRERRGTPPSVYNKYQ